MNLTACGVIIKLHKFRISWKSPFEGEQPWNDDMSFLSIIEKTHSMKLNLIFPEKKSMK